MSSGDMIVAIIGYLVIFWLILRRVQKERRRRGGVPFITVKEALTLLIVPCMGAAFGIYAAAILVVIGVVVLILIIITNL